ncbi:DUF4268 domain-containing protein [Duganella qianjiadongensis]|uniref:DUF4268 domain-containing protein n=1 Tax=Duganella qianjiadongensis TaxID=2692176 RepID=A0ABW9VP62_9BURK|nr:DUF4268 domain-containing protein [Duganella qianjiadongensis]MYM41359.1 DUF4268 domain-containing protein [Duganella qianjiadongensis]
MAIYEITQNSLTALVETSFGAEGIYERKDLQRHLRQNIGVISADLYVIAEEYGEWLDSNRRIDLLCIDRDANLVVIEVKRTEDGGHMELQAIRYAAMLSTMTFRQLVEAHAAFLAPTGQTPEQAEAIILSFLRWESADEDAFATEVRIILVSADFSKEVTMSVMWLNQHGLDIRCIRLKPYRLPDKRLLLDVQQIIPLPEASDFQTQIRAKEQAGREHRAEQSNGMYQFWAKLLEHAKTKSTLHAGRRPTTDGWISGGSGRAGLSFTYSARRSDSQVELYIDVGDKEKNLIVFRHFQSHDAEIEAAFGSALDWQDLPQSRGCRIRALIPGGWRSAKEDWKSLHEEMVDAMVRLERAVRPFFTSIPG